MALRPCGACAELVPADSGCPHWRPGGSVRAERQRRYDNARQAAAGARQRAQQAVDEFRRQQGLGRNG